MPAISLSPQYHLYIDGEDLEKHAALVKAFKQGSGHGLLFLDSGDHQFGEQAKEHAKGTGSRQQRRGAGKTRLPRRHRRGDQSGVRGFDRGLLNSLLHAFQHGLEQGARRIGTLMPMPALPSVSQANPSEPCVTSIATHTAATPATAHERRINNPAAQAKMPMWLALATQNNPNAAQATPADTPACSASTLWIQ